MNASQLTEAEIQEPATKILKFVLTNSITKLPIKKIDITKHCLNGNVKLFDTAFKIASKQLKEIYGLLLTETTLKTSAKSYICTTYIPTIAKIRFTDTDKYNCYLLIIVLSYIYMKGGTVKDQVVFKFLKRFGISHEEEHPLFGDVKEKLLILFPKQSYLLRTKVTEEAVNEVKIALSWGQRAQLEFPRKEMLNEIASVFNTLPTAFVEQHQELYGDREDSNAIEG